MGYGYCGCRAADNRNFRGFSSTISQASGKIPKAVFRIRLYNN